MRAWLFQDSRQKQIHGDAAPWSVGWYDADGRKRSKRVGSKSQADKFRRKKEGELAAGLYAPAANTSWSTFRKEYDAKILPRLGVDTQRIVTTTLKHFERISKPKRVRAIKTQTIDAYVAQRVSERGKKKNSLISPATVNRELRHLKAVLRIAHDWGYLAKVPKIRFVREAEEIGPVVSPEHFQSIYDHCDTARVPSGLPYAPAAWWRALLVFGLTTGWRIEEMLSFRRADFDATTGAILTRAADNKGKRDDRDFLPDVTLSHLAAIAGFEPVVFPWYDSRERLWTEFHRIQRAAGIHLPCPDAGRHECTPRCHVYGFHALRRAYATLNADRMPAPVLQKKMRHRSFTTTQRYIELANKMKKSADQVYVPEFLTERKAN